MSGPIFQGGAQGPTNPFHNGNEFAYQDSALSVIGGVKTSATVSAGNNLDVFSLEDGVMEYLAVESAANSVNGVLTLKVNGVDHVFTIDTGSAGHFINIIDICKGKTRPLHFSTIAANLATDSGEVSTLRLHYKYRLN
jgi:hypothetical protein